jgi:hypothetical protein
VKKLPLTGIAALFLVTGTAHANETAIRACKEQFLAGKLQPGDEIGACYAKATNNQCDGSLDGANAQVCLDWVDDHGWKGAWQDCFSHNFPGRGACVARSCEGNWPGPSDQCSAKAQSSRWLKRAERQRERCRRSLDDPPTYKQIIRFDRCMQAWRQRNRLGS